MYGDNAIMSDRKCGQCTACCEGWLSSEINGVKMMPGTPCSHCTDSGCGIYEHRPVKPCVEFICGWLQDGSPLPEHMRPDQSGVIVLLNRDWMGKNVIRAVHTGRAIPEETLEWLKAYAREQVKPLLLLEFRFGDDGSFKGSRKLGYGPPWFVQAVKTQLIPEDTFRM